VALNKNLVGASGVVVTFEEVVEANLVERG
jgi:hypothetical protein